MLTNKAILYLLLVMNIMVLAGQIWPQGAPPFAHFVNVATLLLDIILLLTILRKASK